MSEVGPGTVLRLLPRMECRHNVHPWAVACAYAETRRTIRVTAALAAVATEHHQRSRLRRRRPTGSGATKLAADTGLAQSSVSRILGGQAPNYDTCVALSRVLKVPLADLLVRTGRANADDFPQGGSNIDQTRVLSERPLSPEEVATAAGVPDEDREWFTTMVRRMRREGGTDESTAGGAAARG